MSSPVDAFQKWRSKWLVGTLEAFIFFALDKKQRYGGELLDLSKEKIDMDIKIPTVYGLINRIKGWGFIENTELSSEEGVTRGTSRKYYTITPLGREYYELLRNQIKELDHILNFDDTIFKEDEDYE